MSAEHEPQRAEPRSSAHPWPAGPGAVRPTAHIAAPRTHPPGDGDSRAVIRGPVRRDAIVAAIADTQHGVVTRSQLRTAGLSDDCVDRMLAGRRLRPLHRGVFAVGHAQLAPFAPETAALLAVGDGAALSHESAAWLWGLFAERPEEEVHVSLAGRQARRLGIRVHRSSSLEGRDLRRVKGLRVTSPARTLLDLAATLSPRRLERAFDEAFARRLLSVRQLEAVLARAQGRHGATTLARLLSSSRTPALTRSAGEELVLELLRNAELPAPEVNARTHGFEVDFLWREQRLVLEMDGWQWHSSRSAFERDRRKTAKLTAAGLRVTRATWRQARHNPIAFVATIAQALILTP